MAKKIHSMKRMLVVLLHLIAQLGAWVPARPWRQESPALYRADWKEPVKTNARAIPTRPMRLCALLLFEFGS
jgi:hypothetical protein